MHRARYGEWGTELPYPLWVCCPPSTLICSPTQSSLYLIVQEFLLVSLHRRVWLSHWWLSIMYSSLPSLNGRTESLYSRTESLNPLLTLFLFGYQILFWSSKGCSTWSNLRLKGSPFKRPLYHSGNVKGFRSSAKNWDQSTNMYFYAIDNLKFHKSWENSPNFSCSKATWRCGHSSI